MKFECRGCSRDFFTVTALKNSKIQYHPRSFKCPFCDSWQTWGHKDCKVPVGTSVDSDFCKGCALFNTCWIDEPKAEKKTTETAAISVPNMKTEALDIVCLKKYLGKRGVGFHKFGKFLCAQICNSTFTLNVEDVNAVLANNWNTEKSKIILAYVSRLGIDNRILNAILKYEAELLWGNKSKTLELI